MSCGQLMQSSVTASLHVVVADACKRRSILKSSDCQVALNSEGSKWGEYGSINARKVQYVSSKT